MTDYKPSQMNLISLQDFADLSDEIREQYCLSLRRHGKVDEQVQRWKTALHATHESMDAQQRQEAFRMLCKFYTMITLELPSVPEPPKLVRQDAKMH